MLIATRATRATNELLRSSLTGCAVAEASSAAELVGFVRTRAIDGVLVEPAVLDADEMLRLGRLRSYPSIPFVALGSLSALLAQAVVRMDRWTNPRLALEGFDTSRIRGFLESCPPLRTRRRLREALAPNLSRLPEDLEAAIEVVCEREPREQAISMIGRLAARSPRGTYDRLRTAGFVLPHRLLEAFAAADVWAFSRDAGFSEADIARKVGRRTGRAVWSLVGRVVGVERRAGLARLEEGELLARLVTRAVSQVGLYPTVVAQSRSRAVAQ